MADDKQDPLYQGSCHCKNVVYQARLSLDKPPASRPIAVATRCNCTICVKSGSLLVTPNPITAFTLISPASVNDLSNYTFASGVVNHRFCPKCGIRCFLDGGEEGEPFCRVNLQTIDGVVKEDGSVGDLEIELKDLEIRYWDMKGSVGLGDNDDGPSDEPASGGFR